MKMKKIIVALTLLVSTSTFAGYDSIKCAKYPEMDQKPSEEMIIGDVLANTPPSKIIPVSREIHKMLEYGGVYGLAEVMYCTKSFDNSQIATEVLGQ